MLRHLLANYERFVTAFSDARVRTLVRILYRKSLRYNIAIENLRLHHVLGARWMLEDIAKIKALLLYRTAVKKTLVIFNRLVGYR